METTKLLDGLAELRRRETGTVDPGFRARIAAALNQPSIRERALKFAEQANDDNLEKTCEDLRRLLADESTVFLPTNIIG